MYKARYWYVRITVRHGGDYPNATGQFPLLPERGSSLERILRFGHRAFRRPVAVDCAKRGAAAGRGKRRSERGEGDSESGEGCFHFFLLEMAPAVAGTNR